MAINYQQYKDWNDAVSAAGAAVSLYQVSGWNGSFQADVGNLYSNAKALDTLLKKYGG